MLISFAVMAKLICVFVFAHAKRRFSRDMAQMKADLHLCWPTSAKRFLTNQLILQGTC